MSELLEAAKAVYLICEGRRAMENMPAVNRLREAIRAEDPTWKAGADRLADSKAEIDRLRKLVTENE